MERGGIRLMVDVVLQSRQERGRRHLGVAFVVDGSIIAADQIQLDLTMLRWILISLSQYWKHRFHLLKVAAGMSSPRSTSALTIRSPPVLPGSCPECSWWAWAAPVAGTWGGHHRRPKSPQTGWLAWSSSWEGTPWWVLTLRGDGEKWAATLP